ncbi:putative ribonucleoside-diphosphate reductase small chain B [Selaginella moellendorffii]|uniref:putative ribonucleoside-diphosphate reductase small chain B n=1 Tax=Selaginella moellendorffii TaxID=88036 RepID=UPI000D1C8C44|nr:putative ribonucleoside-diphosphate reductase small chain B [Selaginella moellendorffii]|eukprot:XP_024536207.1 putative ribonucleoside-diphosphate reductase small chain B [Selaginella moellendorffii]
MPWRHRFEYSPPSTTKEEPILADNPQRFCMFPIRYPRMWEMYIKAKASFSTADLSQDAKHWESLTERKSFHEPCFGLLRRLVLENLRSRSRSDLEAYIYIDGFCF